MDAVSHLLRRSRLRGFAAGAGHLNNPLARVPSTDNTSQDDDISVVERGEHVQLDERFYASLNQFSPEELSSIQAASSAAAAKTAPTAVTTTARQAAQAATRGTTLSSRVVTSTPVLSTITRTSTVVVTPVSTVRAISSSASPSIAVLSFSSSHAISSASAVHSTSTTRTTTTSSSIIPTSTSSLNTNTVLTVTEAPSSVAPASSSAAVSSGTAINAAASGSSSNTSRLSTGGIIGVVLAVLLGLVALGSTIGWLYRKYSSRSYSSRSPWSKMDDDDGITPFPPNEKLIDTHDSDIYGASPAPVIGSRRALALARNNAFASDGSFRPDSEYLDNRAGLGAGSFPSPAIVSPDYGVDAQGRPYRQQAGRTPIPYVQNSYGLPNNSHPLTRQASPPSYPYDQPGLSPVALGRPSVPNTQAQLAQLDDFADMPEPNATGAYLAYEDEEPYTPRTASSDQHWTATPPQNKSRVSMTAPKPLPQLPFQPVQHPAPAAQLPLPVLEPMSPLMNGFDMRRSSQPLQMYLPESTPTFQKRLYGEVAQAAGVAEPLTPQYPNQLNNSTSSTTSHQTTSSFSAHDPTPVMRLPSLTLPPPKPYVHGQPLSPLTEVATPSSMNTIPAEPSSSILHGQRHEVNPFERALIPPKRSSRGSDGSGGLGLVPPYTAGPSPAFPPPSPGGMSVPGSVGSSPRRWSGGVAAGQGLRRTRGDSVFDGEDAYGGI